MLLFIAKRRPLERIAQSAKVATDQTLVASSGAPFATFANLTSALLKQVPPSLQPYLDTTIDLLSETSAYVQSATGLSSAALYSTAGAVVLLGAIPTVLANRATQKKNNGKSGKGKGGNMSRFGWSSRGGELSPFSSNLGSNGVPAVTDDDFSYITSEDLETNGVEIPRHRPRHDAQDATSYGRSPRQVVEEPDVLQIRSKGKTYKEDFPAYSIGDGQVLVRDLQERIQLLLKLSSRQAKNMKLLYKGRSLKESEKPVRDYGVKNNSEVLVIVGEAGQDESSEDSSDEIVVIDEGRKKNKKKKKSRKSKGSGSTGSGARSPPDGGSSTTGLEVPSRTQSPSVVSGVSGASAAAAVPGGPIDKINSLAQHFDDKLLPLCLKFTKSPPTDAKKREDDHRRITETVMQQIILKLDGVETDGQEEARARRREVVRYVQGVLKEMDGRLQG